MFEVLELTHEVEVWRDVCAFASHEIERLVQCVAHRVHDVDDCDGHRATNSRETVNQDALL